jgi:hypothetical protein
MIEAALAECNGKVAGSEGAAAKLGISRSALDSKKMKQLKIKKQKFVSERSKSLLFNSREFGTSRSLVIRRYPLAASFQYVACGPRIAFLLASLAGWRQASGDNR